MVQVVPLVEGEDVLELDQEELSWLVSLGAVGAVVRQLAGGVTVDRLDGGEPISSTVLSS